MDRPLIYASRVVRLPISDADGSPLGTVADIVLLPSIKGQAPVVLGFVAAIQRRRIFVAAARVGELDASGLRLAGGTVDLRHFELRPGELLVSQVVGKRVGGEVVTDLGLRSVAERNRTWEVATVALVPPGPFGRLRATRVVDWQQAAHLFDTGPVAREVAAMRQMHPSDVARRIQPLTADRRRQLIQSMDDERLADLLEELPEKVQVELIRGLDLDRTADVLEEMAPDDAADLLKELPPERQRQLLDAMEPGEADPLRRLIKYDAATAGGLMTSEPVVVPPEATVAEALARLRDPDLPPALAGQVFVAQPPVQTPTGSYLGAVGFQHLLRESPSTRVGECLGAEPQPDPLGPHLDELAVAEHLAAYNLLAAAVCDDQGRLLGAVSVDDVLDRTLPLGWR
ncbi:MAG TPA: CBS domain-containing protein [Acidimicrobiales bacterium]|nr:CBS domain-containing protein [Acidimicrobiales bacterium]